MRLVELGFRHLDSLVLKKRSPSIGPVRHQSVRSHLPAWIGCRVCIRYDNPGTAIVLKELESGYHLKCGLPEVTTHAHNPKPDFMCPDEPRPCFKDLVESSG